MKRSRHQQAGKGGKARFVDAEEGVIAYRELPPKRPGVHRWVATSMHTLTEGQARAAMAAGCVPPAFLDHRELVAVDISCIDCEGSVEQVAEDRCPVDPEDAEQ